MSRTFLPDGCAGDLLRWSSQSELEDESLPGNTNTTE